MLCQGRGIHRPLRQYADIFPVNAPSLATLGVNSNCVPIPFDSETEGKHNQEIPEVLEGGTVCNVYEHLQILVTLFVQ